MHWAILILLTTITLPAKACDVALALTVDVSGSIDGGEYRLQMDGMATALKDPSVAEALVSARAQVAVVQWSGLTRQELSIPWRQITGFADVEKLAQDVSALDRPWRHFSTAIGEAVAFTLPLFDQVACRRNVIDVSGDGRSNEGQVPEDTRVFASKLGVEINALAILGADRSGLTDYFREQVISGPGAFVYEATGYDDYPRAIRRKLLDELTEPLS